MKRLSSTLLAAVLAALLEGPGAAAQDLAAFEARTTVHRLANGWTFLLVDRPGAPVFSFATLVDVGSAQEVPGITGLAHMFEHMAFKGTPNLGTTDYAAEKEALAAVEAAYQAWQGERLSSRPDAARLAELEATFRARQKVAEAFVVKNEFGSLVDREGGADLNASTGPDSTQYFYSLPVNKFELFCYLESERFLHPVFRQFYEEREVVKEERRQGVENNPIGRLLEQMQATAFVAHPYGWSTIGHMSDLGAITMSDAEAFYRRNYVPANMVTAIVGDLDVPAVLPLIDNYFGRIPAGPEPPELRTVEPPQAGERTVVLKRPAQPIYAEGYHRPADTHPDDAVYHAIDDILTNGRASRLYRSLVRDQRLAVAVRSFSGYPGSKYPHLWLLLAYPARGVETAKLQAALRAEIAKLASEEVSAAELTRFKTRARADLLRSLADNVDLAYQLAENQLRRGDWRELFRSLDRIAAVTPADLRRVAAATFQEGNRTVGELRFEAPANPAAAGARHQGEPR